MQQYVPARRATAGCATVRGLAIRCPVESSTAMKCVTVRRAAGGGHADQKMRQGPKI